MKKGIGIIGYGGFGRFLHEQWNRMDNARVVAVADENPDRNPGGEVQFFTDWREMIQQDEVEIVSICTPPSTHAELAIAAMEAGNHVLVEKPLATTVEDAKAIVEARERTGKVAAVNYMLRFNPIIEQITEWAGNKMFGPLRRAVVENYAQDETLPPNHWFWNEAISGGILVEHSVHFLDIVDQLAGSPVRRVQGAASNRNEQQQDQVMALVEYEDGLIASHYHEFARPAIFERTTIRLLFDAAEFELYGWIPTEGWAHALAAPETEQELYRLPNYQSDARQPLHGGRRLRVLCGGRPYEATSRTTGRFRLEDAKLKVYADSLRAMMNDIILAISDSSHQLRSPLEAGVQGLRVALDARAKGQHEE
ncbi:Gfo/Idh/MocA family oxidoreductase [bacterium]|nr:Gfo/Idh/MocA family oxidoreductase [bacterium]